MIYLNNPFINLNLALNCRQNVQLVCTDELKDRIIQVKEFCQQCTYYVTMMLQQL